MKITETETVLRGIKGNVRIRRITGGVPHIAADHEIDLYWGLGYMHGTDRQLAMWLVKLIGQGRASECLKADEELIAVDRYMRWISLGGDAKAEVKKLAKDTRAIVDAYSSGVNRGARDSGVPFEFKLVGYRPDPWTPEDTLLMARIIGFVGLTQSQGEMEKFIIQMIKEGVPIEKLRELLPPMERPKKELVEIIRKVNLVNPMVPDSVKWLVGHLRFSASNNWVVSGKKTKSGKPIVCGDPHLEVNRLPAVWYEAVMTAHDLFMAGATFPGIPALVIGRTPTLAWSVTYGFMDTIDYFIEDVKDKQCLRGKKRVPFSVREEVIRPKKKPPITLRFYEGENGVLEGEPDEDGYWLSLNWSGRRGCVATSMDNILKVPRAKNAKEAMDYFGGMSFAAFNWVMADTTGNIAYQMSGAFPKKAPGTSGLLPYLGWEKSHQWKGTVPPTSCPRAYNPREGYFATANEDFSAVSKVVVQNLPMGSYRGDRIRELLKKSKSLDVEAMKKIQYDVFSPQAELYMKIIRPLLPDTKNGRILGQWDLCYDTESPGATLFERVYEELLRLVFGELGMGAGVVDYAIAETGLFNDFYANFDRILLAKTSAWFGPKPREEIYRAAIERALRKRAVRYGKVHRTLMVNLFFGGKLPRVLGFDFGPIELPGNRATIVQGQVFKMGGRLTSFAPSYRVICDLGDTVIHTNIAGGPSDRRYSPYYTSDIRAWESGRYKVLRP